MASLLTEFPALSTTRTSIPMESPKSLQAAFIFSVSSPAMWLMIRGAETVPALVWCQVVAFFSFSSLRAAFCQLLACTLLLMSHPNRGFLAPKWVTHHFWEIHICGAAPLSINAILPICEGLVAARMTLCAVVNTSHPHIPETHQESRMKAFLG